MSATAVKAALLLVTLLSVSSIAPAVAQENTAELAYTPSPDDSEYTALVNQRGLNETAMIANLALTAAVPWSHQKNKTVCGHYGFHWQFNRCWKSSNKTRLILQE
jgi:hypothetical protein